MGVLSALRHLFHGNWTRRRTEIPQALEEIEKLVLAQLGIVDARVSVRTNAKHERFMRILVRCTSRYKHREQFPELQRKIISAIVPHIRSSWVQIIQVKRMKNPAPYVHASSPDPPLH